MSEKEPVTPEQEVEETPAAQETPATDNAGQEKLTELQKQLEEARNKYLYLLSDFENYKRNASRERMDLMQTAGRDIMAAMLPVLDDFDRAAKSGALNEGMALIHQKLQSTLKSKGLHSLDTKAGDDFNADVHEAVAEIPAASDEHKGKIVDILEPGYLLGERIIRFAKVVVGR